MKPCKKKSVLNVTLKDYLIRIYIGNLPIPYYSVLNKRTGPNKRTCPNKRTGWNFDKNQISVQGGILFKILDCRVKTGNFVHNKRESFKYT